MPRENARGPLAHVTNTETVDQVPEVARLTRLDLLEHIRRGFCRHSLQRNQVVEFQSVEIGNVMHHLLRNQLICERIAETFDTHSPTRSEMKQPSDELRRTIRR